MDKLPNTSKYRSNPVTKPELKEPLLWNRFLAWLENKIYFAIAYRINWLLDRVLSEGFELIVEGNEPGDDGNWRIFIESGNFKIQNKISGTWTTGSTHFEGDDIGTVTLKRLLAGGVQP